MDPSRFTTMGGRRLSWTPMFRPIILLLAVAGALITSIALFRAIVQRRARLRRRMLPKSATPPDRASPEADEDWSAGLDAIVLAATEPATDARSADRGPRHAPRSAGRQSNSDAPIARLHESGAVLAAAAFEEVCHRWSASVGIRTEVVLDADQLDPDAGYQLMWILQEALRNIAAHATATNVTVTLRAQVDVELHVADDGTGFSVPGLDALANSGRLGLAAMTDRVQALGGELEVRSAPGAGTRIIARLPATAAVSALSAPQPSTRRIAALATACATLLVLAVVVGWPASGGPVAGDNAAAVQPAVDPEPSSSAGSGARSAPSPSERPSTSEPTTSESPSPSPDPAKTSASSMSKPLAAGCTVAYSLRSQIGQTFAADLRLTNGGSKAPSGWALRFRFPDGQKLTGSSSGTTATQHGPNVIIGGTGQNVTLAAGETITITIQGTWSRTNDAPSSFTLDGVACG